MLPMGLQPVAFVAMVAGVCEPLEKDDPAGSEYPFPSAQAHTLPGLPNEVDSPPIPQDFLWGYRVGL